MEKPNKCIGCSLEKLGKGHTQVEKGARYEQTRLLLLGEASGANEARDSLPFRPYAQSGSLLADAMREMGISRADVAITNVVRCQPPNDVLEGAWYQYSATNHCIDHYLHNVIQELKPRVILALGGTAFRTAVSAPKGRQGTLDYIRGYAMPGAGAAQGIPVIPTYHPAYLRRGSPHLAPLLQRDLRRAFLIATGKLKEGEHFILDPVLLKGRYQTSPSVAEARAWLQAMDFDRSLYLDLETPYSARQDEDERTSFTDRDIYLIQFTQRRGEGIALPWRDEYIEIAREVLKTPTRKVGHNIYGYDQAVLEANGVEMNLTKGIYDTMLEFHHYHPDLPANLQTVAQYCGFPMAWKHLSDSEPELYGCLDVDATCWADEVMSAVLEREGLKKSHDRYFAHFWPILHDMARRGLPISEPARLELKATIQTEDARADEQIKQLVPDEVLQGKQKLGYKKPPLLKCDECKERFRVDHFCNQEQEDEEGNVAAVSVFVPYTDLAEENGLVFREVTLEKEEKCRCTKKTRPDCDVCAGSGIIPAGLAEMRWMALTEFNPNSSHQVKRYMKFRKHPIPKHAKRTDAAGDAAETTEVKELERLYAKTKDPIYPLLIEKRQLKKVEGTYVEGWEPNRDGRVHTTFTFRPATWQTSSRMPNIQNGLKHGKTPFQKTLAKAFNRMQAAEDGHLMVNFDFKSFHAQTTALEAGLPDYLRLAKIDIHSFVTCNYLKLPERVGLISRSDEEMKDLFKFLKKDEKFKFTRDYKAKRTILGIQFAMGANKLYQLNPDDFDSLSEAKAIHSLIMEELFPGLKTFQNAMRQRAHEDKKLVNKYGAIRWFYDTLRWDRNKQKWAPGDQAEAAVAFLPASHAFGHVRDVMLEMREQGWDERYQCVNTIHDSLVFHCPKSLVDECVHNIRELMEKPSSVLVYAKTAPNGLSVEAEAAVGRNLAEMEEVK